MSYYGYLAKLAANLGKDIQQSAGEYDYDTSRIGKPDKRLPAALKGGALGAASILDSVLSLVDMLGNIYGYTAYGKGKSARPFEDMAEKGIDWLTNEEYADKNLSEEEKNLKNFTNEFASFVAPLAAGKAASKSPKIAGIINKYNLPVEKVQNLLSSKITNKYGKGLFDFVAEMSKIPTKDTKLLRETLLKYLPAHIGSKLASENFDQESMLGRLATSLTPLATSAAQRSINGGTKKYINKHVDPEKVKLFEKLDLNPDLGSVLKDESVGAARLKQLITALGQTNEGTAARLNADKFLENIGESIAGRTRGNPNIESATDKMLNEIKDFRDAFHSEQQKVRNPIREKLKTDLGTIDNAEGFLKNLEQTNPNNFKQFTELSAKYPNDKSQLLEMFGYDAKKGAEGVTDPKAFNMKNTHKAFQEIARGVDDSSFLKLKNDLSKPIDFNTWDEKYKVLQKKNHPDSSTKVLNKNQLGLIRDAVNSDFKTNMERLNLQEDLAKWVKTNEDYTKFFNETSRNNWDQYQKVSEPPTSPTKRVKFLENELLDQKIDPETGKPKKRIVEKDAKKADTPAINKFAGGENFKEYINELMYSMGHSAGDKFNASRFFNAVGNLDKNTSMPVLEHFWKKANPDAKGSLEDYREALLHNKNAHRTANTSFTAPTSDTLNTIDNVASAPAIIALGGMPKKTLINFAKSILKTMISEETVLKPGGLKELVKNPTLESYLPTAKNVQALRKLVKNETSEKENENEPQKTTIDPNDPFSFWN